MIGNLIEACPSKPAKLPYTTEVTQAFNLLEIGMFKTM
jgi:hypothetical protein